MSHFTTAAVWLSRRLSASAALCLLFVAVFLTGVVAVRAATLPPGFSETLIASGLSNPTAMAFAPDGRLFVCEQGGRLRVIKNGALLATAFLTLDVDPQGERGLLGIAFDPNFTTNQYLYLYYTARTPAIHNRVSRFTASGDGAVAGSEVVVLDLENLSSATNHNGGAMHFGSDGKLYVAVGDNANGANAQTLNNRLGKMLRLNPDGTIPTDNPFYNATSGLNRSIWALGLRNPFTFAFQPDTTRMFINDVGQNDWEEINDGIAGANYGWPTTEGPTTDPRYHAPICHYGHGSGPFVGCAITGGAFYNPPAGNFPPEYTGVYFFADYCGGWINRFDVASGAVTTFATNIFSPVDLRVAADGSLYYLERGGGAVYRIRYTANQAPVITQHPASRTVSAGQSATFTLSASGTAPLSYQWQRDGAAIAGASSPSYTTPLVTAADNGARFRCLVTNAFGSAVSHEAVLTVTANQSPTATITTPAAGTLYSAGQTITYAGAGTDPEEGNLPASAFTWRVDFHHDAHAHPFLPATSGTTGGSFTIPTTGETSTNVWYRIYLTVRDGQGMSHTTVRDLHPRVVSITVATDPAGLEVTVDGQPVTAPYSFPSVVGMMRSIGAASQQTLGGATYRFQRWSDGGAQTHNIATPSVNATYRAVYKRRR